MPRTKLKQAVTATSPELRARLESNGFELERFLDLAATIAPGDAAARRDTRNRVRGEVRAPGSDEILEMPRPSTPESELLGSQGSAAIARGELAFCVMAGGMATRMGGRVKALVEAYDGKSFLDVRLEENRVMSDRAKRPIPLWLMTSDATDGPINDALLGKRAGKHVATFRQDLSLRLTADGALFLDDRGAPSTYATGHGDLPDALRRSALLSAFLQNGGRSVWITNVDNLGATIDPVVLGAFIASSVEVMVEVCDKVSGDRGGIPAHAEGRLQILEEFRLPKSFDAAQVRVFNTNTFLVRADALNDADHKSMYYEVEKKVDGRIAIQFERLLQELTAHLSAAYIRVPRNGVESRFEPVKDMQELEQRRAVMREISRRFRA